MLSVRFECCDVHEEVIIPGFLDKLGPVKG